MSAIVLTVRESAGRNRHAEIVSVGVPLPRGAAKATQRWHVRSCNGTAAPCQVQPLALWPEQSVQWMTASFPATIGANGSAEYELLPGECPAEAALPVILISETDQDYCVDTGAAQFHVSKQGARLLGEVRAGRSGRVLSTGMQARLSDRTGTGRVIRLDSVEAIARGPLVAKLRFAGHVPKTGLMVRGEWTFRAGSGCPTASRG